MKKFYSIFIVFLFFQQFAFAEIRTWTGNGDGHSWSDAYNWNIVTCKTIDGDGVVHYNTAYVLPRIGEIVVFDGMGSLVIDNLPSYGFRLGNSDYMDYSDVVNGCIGGYNSFAFLYSLQIINNSYITFSTSSGFIVAGGTANLFASYPEALKIENSTLTCDAITGNYGVSEAALNINSINAESSTININSTSFYPSGKTYFNNCVINCKHFSPQSNNDHPNEKDEFHGCTINTEIVYFGGKCDAEVYNSTFNVSGDQFALNSSGLLNNVLLDNIQINVGVNSSSLFVSYQQGANSIKGNITCNSTVPNFQIFFNNSTYPTNIKSFPFLLDGNLILKNGSILIGNSGMLNITGNLEMNGTPDANLTKDVFINNQSIFQIGGSSNFTSYNGAYGPIPSNSPFSVKFSGSGDSHIKWPIGFPVDTLIIEKTGCSKVYLDNAPIHITGKLNVKSGQLVLNPIAGLPYVMVNGANTQIDDGGSILLNTDAGSNKSNIALGGNFVDANTVNNSSTCNGFNNTYMADVSFYNNQYSPAVRSIGIFNSGSLGNLKLINTNTDPYNLTSALSVQNIDLGTKGNIVLGNNNLFVNGSITGYDATKFIITDGTGNLVLKNIGGVATKFPIGISSTSYTPLTITNNGTMDDFRVRVQSAVLSGGTNGTSISSNVVNRTWIVEEAISGGSNVQMIAQWNAVDELTDFNRNEIYLGHYFSPNWNTGALTSAAGSSFYTVTRSGLTSFSPFAVLGKNSVPEFIDEDNDGYPVGTDCNDNNAAIHPNATEICNGIDDNCDGQIDEGLSLFTYYQDNDADGFGNSSVSIQSCSQPSGYVTTSGDCNDNNAAINPGASEICGNGFDDNCNGQVDEGCTIQPQISISDVTVYESQGMATLTVSLTNISTQSIKISYNTVDGTAIGKGKGKNPAIDYEVSKGFITIPSGSLYGTINITIINDGLPEQTEYFDVEISILKNVSATISDGSGRVTILDGIAPLIASRSSLNTSKSAPFELKSWPNPSKNEFNLKLNSTNRTDKMEISVYDLNGRRVYYELGNASEQYHFGNKFEAGIYMVKVSQAGNVKIVHLVKY